MDLEQFAAGKNLKRDYIRTLRKEGKHELVYNALKTLCEQQPDNDFFEAEFLKSIVYYKPNASEEIKTHADNVFKTDRKDIAEFGYTVYYLSINEPNKAYEHFKKINDSKNLKEHIRKILGSFKCGKDFRKLIFDRDLAIEEIQSSTLSNRRYVKLTYDVGENFFDVEDYVNAVRYFKKSLKK